MDLDAVAVEFDLVDPAIAAGDFADRGRQSRFNEAGGRAFDTTGWRLWPEYGIRSNQPKGQLTCRAGIAGNEVTDMLGDGVALDVEAGLDFEGDIFRDVF
jgi:hypothetical protein